MTLRGTVTLVSADNLAAQAIGGYKALHSAFRKCRYCMAVDADIQIKVCMKSLPQVYNQIKYDLYYVH